MTKYGLVPVTASRHGHRFWKRFASYHFAAARVECATVVPEVTQAAAAFPIVFKETGGGFEPMVLLSLSEEPRTPFVSQDGRWLASYVPSALRCHPFQAELVSQHADNRNPIFQLFVDESSGLLSDSRKDEAFYDEKGGLSPPLLEVRSFLQSRSSAQENTRALCQLIDALGLFEPCYAYDQVALPSGSFGISTQRLQRLPKVEKLKLIESDAFLLIHAHQVSLSHCAWLAHAEHQLKSRFSQEKYTKNSEVSGFLDAVAYARLEELNGV